ncbi:MAG: TonB-dependent receptor [Sphingorhabdus sp.]
MTGNLSTSGSEITEAVVDVDLTNARIENSLREIPGVQQFRRSDARSAHPTSQGVTLRGLGGNASSRALLFVDGVPQADPFGGWVSWPGYDALNLASIRIRRGGGQPSAGPGALGGIIELDSRQWPYGTKLSAAYGSRNSVDAKASTLFGVGAGHISVSANYARGDGFTPIVARLRGSVDRGAKYSQAGLALRAVAPLSDDTELQANLRGFFDDRDRGFDFSDNENSGADASLRIVNRGDGWQYSALAYLQLREFSTRFGSVAADRNSVRLVFDQFSVPSTGLGARFEVRPPVGDDAELRIGGDWRRTIGETRENFFFAGPNPRRNRNAGGRSDTLGGFIEGSFKPSDALTLTAGGRLDRWSISDGFRKEINLSDASIRNDLAFADRSGWQGTGRAGIAFQASDAIKLRGAAYAGWRLPTLNELYRPFRVGADATAANELLRPEQLKGAEIGFEYDDSDVFDLSATLFWNRLDNGITNVTLANGPGLFPGVGFVSGAGVFRQRQNLDAVESVGIELDANIDITDSFSLRAGYAYIDAEVSANGAAIALDGLRPAQVAKHHASGSLIYDGDVVRGSASIRYIGQQFEDDLNTRSLGDALTIGARLAYDISDNLTLEAYGENLFNAEVQAAVSRSGIIERATPRTLWLGVKIKL